MTKEELIRADGIRKAIEDNPNSGFREVTGKDGSVEIFEWNDVEGEHYLLHSSEAGTSLYRLERSWVEDQEQDGKVVRTWPKGDAGYTLN